MHECDAQGFGICALNRSLTAWRAGREKRKSHLKHCGGMYSGLDLERILVDYPIFDDNAQV